MKKSNPAFLDRHGLALVVFASLATIFLWDVLLLNYSLGAFDIILNHHSWKDEFPIRGIHQPILSDSPTAHYPQRELEWGHVAQFKNIELNPYMFTGMPWSPQGAGGFVTSLPQLFLEVHNAIDWSTWVRMVCAGFFMYLLCLELGMSRLAGIFAGVLWTYNLHQIVWLEFPQHLATQLWIPLIFLLNVRILRGGLDTASAVGLVVANVLFFTSGYMQIVLYTYVTIGMFNTFYVLLNANGQGMVANGSRWVAVHGLYLGAVALCAVGLYAEATTISEGLRGAQAWRGRVDAPTLSLGSVVDFVRVSVPQLNEVTHMLSPHYYGGFWSGGYSFNNGNVVESSRYFGILGLLLAATALFTAPASRHARLVAVFVLVMAVVFSLIYRNDFTISVLRLIPLADKGSYSRFITLLTFMGCVLAGFGFQHALVDKRWRWVYGALAVSGVYIGLAWLQLEALEVARFWYPATIVALFLLLLVAWKRLGYDWGILGCAVLAMTVLDLFSAGYRFNTRMDNELLFPKNNAIRFLLNDPEPYRVANVSDTPMYHPNILSYYDIPVVEGYLTVLPVDYATYMKEVMPDVRITRNGIMFIMEPDVEALRLMGVKYVMSDKLSPGNYPGLELVLETNNHQIYRVRDSLTRVYCASDVFFAEDRIDRVRKYGQVIREAAEPIVLEGDGGRIRFDAACDLHDIQVFTHGVSAVVESPEERYLVIPYAYNRNWHASINGERASLLMANGYHMALKVPAGRSSVDIFYRNQWNVLSAWVLVAAALGLLGFVVRYTHIERTTRWVLGAVALVIMFKSALSIPVLRNDEIPERAPLGEQLQVVEQGLRRSERDSYSERIHRGEPGEFPLNVPSIGLTRLSLMAGTFRHPELAGEIALKIVDQSGNTLVSKQVDGNRVLNNRWFTIEFPPLKVDGDLFLRVSAEGVAKEDSFVLWFDPEGRLCVTAYYQLDPVSRTVKE